MAPAPATKRKIVKRLKSGRKSKPKPSTKKYLDKYDIKFVAEAPEGNRPFRYQRHFEVIDDISANRYHHYNQQVGGDMTVVNRYGKRVRDVVDEALRFRAYNGRNEPTWRDTAEVVVFGRFGQTIRCRVCGKERWRSEYEAEPLDEHAKRKLKAERDRRSGKSLCDCNGVETISTVIHDDSDEDMREPLFATGLSQNVDHDDADELWDSKVQMQPDRVYGLRKTAHIRELIDRNQELDLTHDPMAEDGPILYPFIVLEAKKANNAPGFSPIDEQTAFPIRRFLKIQEQLKNACQADLDPLVWFFAYQGPIWRLSLATMHEGKTRVFDLWLGSVERRDGALHLLQMVDYIWSWARDVFNPQIRRCLAALPKSVKRSSSIMEFQMLNDDPNDSDMVIQHEHLAEGEVADHFERDDKHFENHLDGRQDDNRAETENEHGNEEIVEYRNEQQDNLDVALECEPGGELREKRRSDHQGKEVKTHQDSQQDERRDEPGLRNMMDVRDENNDVISANHKHVQSTVRRPTTCLFDAASHTFLRWANHRDISKSWVVQSMIRHSDIVEFTFRVLEIPEDESQCQRFISTLHQNHDMSVLQSLSALVQKDRSAHLLRRRDISEIANFWTRAEGDLDVASSAQDEEELLCSFLFFRSFCSPDNWQIRRELYCIVWKPAAAQALARYFAAEQGVGFQESEDLYTPASAFVEPIEQVRKISGRHSLAYAASGVQLILMPTKDSETGLLQPHWRQPQADTTEGKMVRNLSGLMETCAVRTPNQNGQDTFRRLLGIMKSPEDEPAPAVLLECCSQISPANAVIAVKPQRWTACPRFCLFVFSIADHGSERELKALLLEAIDKRHFLAVTDPSSLDSVQWTDKDIAVISNWRKAFSRKSMLT